MIKHYKWRKGLFRCQCETQLKRGRQLNLMKKPWKKINKMIIIWKIWSLLSLSLSVFVFSFIALCVVLPWRRHCKYHEEDGLVTSFERRALFLCSLLLLFLPLPLRISLPFTVAVINLADHRDAASYSCGAQSADYVPLFLRCPSPSNVLSYGQACFSSSLILH